MILINDKLEFPISGGIVRRMGMSVTGYLYAVSHQRTKMVSTVILDLGRLI